MKEHNENDERKTVSIQEPEITREKNENDGGFQYKKDERYCLECINHITAHPRWYSILM